MKNPQKKIDAKNLRSEVNSLKKNLMNLNFQKATGQLEKTAEIRKTKKKIAFLKTQINQNKGISNA